MPLRISGRRRPRHAAPLAIALATSLITGCAYASQVSSASVATSRISASTLCIPPTPVMTFVPAPSSPDSTAAYTSAVGMAALSDAMANAQAMGEYHRCLATRDSI